MRAKTVASYSALAINPAYERSAPEGGLKRAWFWQEAAAGVWAILLVTVGFGAVGFADDYAKVTKQTHDGVSGRLRLGVGEARRQAGGHERGRDGRHQSLTHSDPFG